MVRRTFSRPRLLVWVAAVGAGLLAPPGAWAQGNPIGSNDVVKAYHEHRNRFEVLLKGEEQPGPDDRAIPDALAQWFIYPMTWTKEKRDTLNDFKGRTLRDHAAALKLQVETHANPKADKNQAFMKQWTERMVATFKDAFAKLVPNAKENRVAIVNIALLLPVYAKTRHEGFGEYLESVLADEKQHDVVKLYAVKALREYFIPFAARPHKASDDPEDEGYKELQLRIARDTQRVQALLNFVNRKWDGMDPAVAQFIRREAIQTLAEARVPAMDLRKGKVVAPVAYTLARFLAPGKDGPYPPPSLSEKCEAAIGILQLDTRGLEGYNPEPALYLAGQFLLEFTTEYTKDYAHFGGKLGVKKDERKTPPVLPWKFMSERLVRGLEFLKSGVRDNHPAFAKAMKLRDKAQQVIAVVRSHGRLESPVELQQAVNALAPKGWELYKGNKEYQVPPAAPAVRLPAVRVGQTWPALPDRGGETGAGPRGIACGSLPGAARRITLE
jgi:hypothetical protein